MRTKGVVALARPPLMFFIIVIFLYYPCVFQSSVGAVFLDSFDGLGGNGEIKRFIEFGHKDFLFL